MNHGDLADKGCNMQSFVDSAILGATLIGSFGAAFMGQKIMLEMFLKAMWNDKRHGK